MRLTLEEKYIFAHQMAMILKSGFALQQGIEMIVTETDNKHLHDALENVFHLLNEDVSLSEAILKSEAFDDYMVHLIQVGEVSGNLDEVMSSLSDYYFHMNDMSEKFKQALTYPVILLLMMFVVVGVIVFQVLPIFDNVLKSLGSELSAYAYTFMTLGQTLSMIGFVVLALITIFIVCIYLYSRIHHIDIMYQIIQKSFFTHSLAKSMNQAQLTYALSMFIKSGYDYQEALEYAMKLVDDDKLRSQLEKCCQDISKGEAFVDVIKTYHIYQGMPLNMIQVGFKTGQIDQTMTTLASYYQEEVNQSIDRFLNIVEPTIVTFLSVIVGIVLLSVMLPLMSILTSL